MTNTTSSYTPSMTCKITEVHVNKDQALSALMTSFARQQAVFNGVALSDHDPYSIVGIRLNDFPNEQDWKAVYATFPDRKRVTYQLLERDTCYVVIGWIGNTPIPYHYVALAWPGADYLDIIRSITGAPERV